MTAHTLGPWNCMDDAGHPSNIRVGSVRRRHIAKVYAIDADRDLECEANARLMAAAPDLLAALEGLVGAAYGGEIPLPIAGGSENSYWRDAVAAIDKVK